MPNELENIQKRLQSDEFADFYHAKSSQNPHDKFVVGLLSPEDMLLLAAKSSLVLLSRITLSEHTHHKEIDIDEYRKLPEIIAKGEIWNREQKKYVLLLIDGMTYRAALKVTLDGSENYLTSLFKQSDKKADTEIRKKVDKENKAKYIRIR